MEAPGTDRRSPPGQGVDELFEAMDQHYRHILEQGLLNSQRLERARFEVESVIQEWGRRRTREGQGLIEQVAYGGLTPEEAAQQLLFSKG